MIHIRGILLICVVLTLFLKVHTFPSYGLKPQDELDLNSFGDIQDVPAKRGWCSRGYTYSPAIRRCVLTMRARVARALSSHAACCTTSNRYRSFYEHYFEVDNSASTGKKRPPWKALWLKKRIYYEKYVDLKCNI